MAKVAKTVSTGTHEPSHKSDEYINAIDLLKLSTRKLQRNLNVKETNGYLITDFNARIRP
jgi:hypothetical protein